MGIPVQGARGISEWWLKSRREGEPEGNECPDDADGTKCDSGRRSLGERWIPGSSNFHVREMGGIERSLGLGPV